MFTKGNSSRIRHEFWTTFGRYMSPVPSAEGMKINWVNYHTGVKDIYFRMDAHDRSASISISIEHRDRDAQELYFNQFIELKHMLHNELGEEWDWKVHVVNDDNRVTSVIRKTLPNVSILNRDQWPDLISFFKSRIIALDSFWENAKYGFM